MGLKDRQGFGISRHVDYDGWTLGTDGGEAENQDANDDTENEPESDGAIVGHEIGRDGRESRGRTPNVKRIPAKSSRVFPLGQYRQLGTGAL